ncbi:helix-turn-helix domain-containing protein [Aquimarina macrocephali]|uniref:helix-turn-helix domain-containing protein n=1 Tax=Aquimarina macrocephali TaxID=666563 RepID=UPI000A055117
MYKTTFLDKRTVNSLFLIAYETGFNSLSSFNYAFKKLEGITPSTFRNQNSSN